MSTTQVDIPPLLKRAGTRFGYGVAVVVNVAILVAVQYVHDWGWLPFLNDQVAGLVPWISLGLLATILANVVYQFNDTPVVKSTGQILVNLVTILVTYRILVVFPFDFSESAFNWEVVVRVFLILAIAGTGIGVLTEAIKLASSEPQHERR